MLTFTPLLGARSSSTGATSSLLELDSGIKILIDIGWDAAFAPAALAALEQHVSTLSILLLTHATVEHIGAYAHACKHVPGFRRVPVYATTPVANLGRGVLGDMYANTALAASWVPTEGDKEQAERARLLLQAPTAEEIGSYFADVNLLKYSQPHQPLPSPFSPSLTGLTITAYSAGHTLGGTVWHIQHGLESIVYASDWNLGRENFFPGAAWLDGNDINEPLFKPTTLVCSSRGAERPDVLPRKDRDARMVSLIRETIVQGGKVLIPTDAAARALELAFVLNRVWKENVDGPHAGTYKNTRIYMASASAGANARYLQSMLEWMDEAVVRDAEAAMTKGKGSAKVQNPLDWQFVKQIERRRQVEQALKKNKPCVILASDVGLDWGLSKAALQTVAQDEKNLIILTEKPAGPKGGVAKQLWDLYRERPGQTSAQSGARVVSVDGSTVQLREATTSPLDADETSLYNQFLARQRQMHSTLQGDGTLNGTAATADVGNDQASESSESSDEDEDAEHQGRALNLSAQLTQNKRKVGPLTDAELGINILLRSKNAVHDFDVRNKRGRERMFPFVVRRAREDEFGEVIRPDEYLRAEERDEADGVDLRQTNASVGQKRKWADNPRGKGNNRTLSNKKQKGDLDNKVPATSVQKHAPDAIDVVIAAATGTLVKSKSAVNGTNDDSEGSGSDESDYDPHDDEASASGPRKAVFSTVNIAIRCRLAHVDFSGRYRLADLQGLIPRIRPRKLILIAGDETDTQAVAAACREMGAKEEGAVGEILTPAVGESVDASVDTQAWTLRLGRALVRRLQWKDLLRGGTLSVASVSGLLDISSRGSTHGKEDEGEGEEGRKKRVKTGDTDVADATSSSPASRKLSSGEAAPALLPALEPLPPHRAQTHKPSRPVHVGDLRLMEIRAQLAGRGHVCEFRGQGALVVDGAVVVRKSLVTGGLEVEGAGLARRHAGRVMGCIYERLGTVEGG